MEKWNKIWEPQDSTIKKLSVRYGSPLLGILIIFWAFYGMFLRDYSHKSLAELIVDFVLFSLFIMLLTFFPTAGLNPLIKIYKEGIWLKPACALDILGIKLTLFGKEKWLEWVEIIDFKIMSEITLGTGTLTNPFEQFLTITIYTKKDNKLFKGILLNYKNSQGLRDAIITAGQESKLT